MECKFILASHHSARNDEMLCPLIKLTILGSEPVIHPVLQQKNDFVNKKKAKVSAAPAAMPADCRCE